MFGTRDVPCKVNELILRRPGGYKEAILSMSELSGRVISGHLHKQPIHDSINPESEESQEICKRELG